MTTAFADNVESARQQFLAGGELKTDVVPPEVLRSWRRSLASRVDPDHLNLPYLNDPDTDTRLVHAATPVLRWMADELASQAVSVILTSPSGLVLERFAADLTLMRALDDVQLARGFNYAEEFAGTNGIGTALATGHPAFIQGGQHYVGALGRLACAGWPIRDPITGRTLGAVDLTCWASQSDPHLLTLAKSAGRQVEDRLGLLACESETALLHAYRRHDCRYSGGVLAIGGDVVLMNSLLQQGFNTADQAVLLSNAAEMAGSAGTPTVITTLPSGTTVRISLAERVTTPGRVHSAAVFHVQTQQFVQIGAVPGGQRAQAFLNLPGRSSSWLRCCRQVERCYRDLEWTLIEGERGSGRSTLAQAVVRHVTPERTVRVLRYQAFGNADAFTAELEAELAGGETFAVIIADLDELPEEALETVGALLQTVAGRGWIAATIDTETHPGLLDTLILPFFHHTVTVPALRHRIEDLDELVPWLLQELSHGANVRLTPAAMRQLAKLTWPGNVAQLRRVLAETLATQRSGTIDVDKLPAECRALARRKLTQLESLERDAIVRSLLENNGSKTDAAQALGISRATIYRKIKEFGIA
ncbi:helix-turn-helix domain-containing protein [Mycobacterium sp.]|uniref:sigma-54-dependent Fis family transcriptional regulator n=1 Tax=Mycobacterium sp. TaxID=1785 RepID=UPI001271F561|nr:helix-turn-helix domain-containing protein [Mycobacterium sp.]KAA8959848.1 MAG: siderophore-interacting protein [Mycobacterium sp.]